MYIHRKVCACVSVIYIYIYANKCVCISTRVYVYINSMCIYLDYARIFQNWILFQHVFSASKSLSLRSRNCPAHGAPPIVAPTCGKPIENHRFARIYDEMMGLTRLNLIHINMYTYIHTLHTYIRTYIRTYILHTYIHTYYTRIHLYIYITYIYILHIYITYIYIFHIYMLISDPKHQPIAEGSISRTTKTWNIMKFQPHCSKWPPSACWKPSLICKPCIPCRLKANGHSSRFAMTVKRVIRKKMPIRMVRSWDSGPRFQIIPTLGGWALMICG